MKRYLTCSDFYNAVVIAKLLIKYLCCWFKKVSCLKIEWETCYLAVLCDVLKYKDIVILAPDKYPVQIIKMLGVGDVVHVNRLCEYDLYVSLSYFSGYHWGMGR